MGERHEKILLVDDEESILSSLQRLFRTDSYHTYTALSAEEGLRILDQNHIWLVISDNIMPGMSGVQFLKEVRDRWPDVVRIMLTGCADLNSTVEAINRGEVYRFVTKPWDPDELRMLVDQGLEQHRLIQENRRIRALIEEQNAMLRSWAESLKQTVEERSAELAGKNDELAKLSQQMEYTVRKRSRAEEELRRTLDRLKRALCRTVDALATTAGLRDPYTAAHQRRVSQLAYAIAVRMGLSEEQVQGIRVAAILHDLGKICVPAEILNKPGQLTEIEFGLVKAHPEIGFEILRAIEFPWPVAQVVLQHHERMNGSGYPRGLSGEGILLEARILAVADVVESMSSHRPYRPAQPVDSALDEISRYRGTLYDSEAVDACLKLVSDQAFRFSEQPGDLTFHL